jgi:GntR family transcriptional regulator
MEAERLLTRRQGRGTFVNDPASDELSARFCNLRTGDGARIEGQVRILEVRDGSATDVEKARLHVEHDIRVYRVRRVRHHGDRPLMIEEAILPARLFPGLPESSAFADRISVLSQHYGILLGRAEERISIEAAPTAIAADLGIAAGAPVMVLDRLLHTLDGVPVEWRIARCHLGETYYLAEMQ